MASDYELGTVATLVPVYVRGLAYLGLGDGRNAHEQFQRILNHRGTDPFSPVCALAQLGLARALALEEKPSGRAGGLSCLFYGMEWRRSGPADPARCARRGRAPAGADRDSRQ